MNTIKNQSFWELINTLDKLKLLPYIMVMGSWAEYLYTEIFTNDYVGHIETKDVDLLYLNINRPPENIPIINALKEIGYIYVEDPLTGVAKFQKHNVLEIEFLTRALGSASSSVTKINPLSIKAESLRVINILEQYPKLIQTRGYTIKVPEPSAYVIQKILTNPTRTPAWKKPKDIESCNKLLQHIIKSEYDKNLFLQIYNNLSKKQKKTFHTVVANNDIVLADIIIQGIEFPDDLLKQP